MSLRVVFIGSPEFSVPTLELLIKEFHVVGVVTQRDKPKGRGRKVIPTPVKDAAVKADIPVAEPVSVSDPEFLAVLKNWAPDVLVVFAYGKILPKVILDYPRLGCVNLHTSLLPRHRGPSPTVGAIMAGDETTGACTMIMDEGMDTGPILLEHVIHISDSDTTGSILEKLAEPGAALMVKTLKLMEKGELTPRAQDHDKAVYTRLVNKETGRIDWNKEALFINRLVRSMNPWPGAFFDLAGDRVRVWESEISNGSGTPGVILECSKNGILAATGNGLILLKKLQSPGKKIVSGAEFARSRHLEKGSILQ